MPKQNQTKIIVAEDDTAMAEIVSHKLDANVLMFGTRKNGLQAVEMIGKDIPDCWFWT